jgi:hypothetical protein
LEEKIEFKLLSANEDANNPNDQERSRDSEEPGWEDRLSMWHAHDLILGTRDTGIAQEHDTGPDIDLSSLDAKDNSEDDNEEYVISQFSEAWNFLIEGEAYQWLLGKIRAQLVLNETGTVMEAIRTTILRAFDPTRAGNAYHPRTYKATFEVAWCPATFIQDQFPEEPDIRLGAILVLTGSRLDAQATTCAQYMHQTWPTTGEEFLLALEHMVANELTELYSM